MSITGLPGQGRSGDGDRRSVVRALLRYQNWYPLEREASGEGQGARLLESQFYAGFPGRTLPTAARCARLATIT